MNYLMSVNFNEISYNELMLIDGGDWSWSEFGTWTGSAAVAASIGGATLGGTVGSVIPGAGTVTGVVIGGAGGFVVGAAIGAIGYSLFGWW